MGAVFVKIKFNCIIDTMLLTWRKSWMKNTSNSSYLVADCCLQIKGIRETHFLHYLDLPFQQWPRLDCDPWRMLPSEQLLQSVKGLSMFIQLQIGSRIYQTREIVVEYCMFKNTESKIWKRPQTFLLYHRETMPYCLFKACTHSYIKNPRHLFNIYIYLYTPLYYSWCMSCLVSFVWISPSCEEREASEKFKMEICLQWDSNPQPSAPHAGISDDSATDEELCLKVLHNHCIWIKCTSGNTCKI